MDSWFNGFNVAIFSGRTFSAISDWSLPKKLKVDPEFFVEAFLGVNPQPSPLATGLVCSVVLC